MAIPEHHLINASHGTLTLQLAVKLAALTRNVGLVASIAVLPVRDMRIFAGEVVQAHMLCDERLVLGVGRGACATRSRGSAPRSIRHGQIVESLQVLEALLTREEVSWQGEFHDFEPLTIMPTPFPIPLMIAAMAPDSIYDSANAAPHPDYTAQRWS